MAKICELKHQENCCLEPDAPLDEIEEIETEDESENIMCYHCDGLINNDDYFNVVTDDGTQPFCPDCFYDNCFQCPDCNENFLNKEFHIVYRDNNICNSCSENYYYCNHCDSYIYYEDYNSERDCCYECGYERNTGVEDYHSSDYWEFIGECKTSWKGKWRGIGIALEIDRDEDDNSAEKQTVSDIRDIYNNLKFEYDGSLEHGFEIITYPHTVEEFYTIDWTSILKACKRNGYVSHSATHCGLHVHFSRVMFGTTEKRQATSISKLINFFERFWDDIIKVSRRTYEQADEYAGKYGITDINEVRKLAKNKRAGRYFAVNNTNCDTVEIRIMRGTLDINHS